jgi:hypothetical protein
LRSVGRCGDDRLFTGLRLYSELPGDGTATTIADYRAINGMRRAVGGIA